MAKRTLLALAVSIVAISGADAQVRFPGDSPSRPAMLGSTTRSTSILGRTSSFSSSQVRSAQVAGVSGTGGVFVAGPGFYRYANPYWFGVGSGCCGFCGGVGSFCRCGPVWLPPVAADGGQLYGPRALIGFMGAEDDFGLGGRNRLAGANAAQRGAAPR
ncbi:MAG: hypothetical protein AAGJ46_04660, partial [Planctomycetota bacterium]